MLAYGDTIFGGRMFDNSDFQCCRAWPSNVETQPAIAPVGTNYRPMPITFEPIFETDLYVEIDNKDRSSRVEWQSLQVQNILTRQVDTCALTFKKIVGETFNVETDSNIKVYASGSLVFQGVVTSVNTKMLSAALVSIDVEAVDYTRELDGKLVNQAYEDQTISYIINDIVAKVAPQFGTLNVTTTQTLGYANFVYQTASKAFEELSDMSGFDWYVDQYKQIHFGDSSEELAPFDLNDDNQSYVRGTLEFSDDISQIKNVIFVRGGNERVTSTTYTTQGNGVQKTFTLGFHFETKPTVTVAAVSKTVGYYGVDSSASYDCLWSQTGDFIVFTSAPAAAAQVDVVGVPLIPIRYKLPDRASITEHGERQMVIVDKTITTREGARDRARAEILKYASSLVSAKFSCRTTGLRAGQTMTVDSTTFDKSGDYVITQVATRMFTPTSFIYDVTLVSTKLMDIVDLLSAMLESRLKDQEYSANESFDPSEYIEETVTITETTDASTTADSSLTETVTTADTSDLAGGTGLNYGTIFVVGPWTPSSTKRQFNVDRSPLG